MVEQKMEKTYRENCKRNCNEISQSIQEFSRKYAMNFGESPVICWVNDDVYADMSLRASLARHMECDIVVMPSTDGALERWLMQETLYCMFLT